MARLQFPRMTMAAAGNRILPALQSALAIAVLTITVATAAAAGGFQVNNIVSDGSVPAAQVDTHLVNAWGISYSPTGPFWISSNGAGVSTIYNGSGTTLLAPVTVPEHDGGASSPTGQVFNGGPNFLVRNTTTSAPAVFIFATEGGSISGWNPTIDIAHATLAVDRSATHTVYKGLAISHNFFGDILYATDFHNRKIDAFDSRFRFLGSFTDPFVPRNYAPFGIQSFDGLLYVTFAQQHRPDFKDDEAGLGHGYIDVFSSYGYLLGRLVSRGRLNSPWGLAVAPDSFGDLAGSLLVGNFGDGHINAYDPFTGQYLGTLKDKFGSPIVLDGLWGLIPGNGGKGGDVDKIYFTAGPSDESHGLFGSIAPDTSRIGL